MSVFFSADPHIGHVNIIDYCSRPFRTVEEMTEGLVQRHNAVVGKADTVIWVGDMALRFKTLPEFMAQLNGTHHLIAGNHDLCWSGHRKGYLMIQKYLEIGFSSVQSFMRTKIGKHYVLVSHFPYRGSGDHTEGEERYSQYRFEDEGMPLLHGHVHNEWDIGLTQNDTLMINVGVDAWNWYPAPVEKIEALLDAWKTGYGVSSESF